MIAERQAREARAEEWRKDPASLKAWIEVKTLMVLQRLEEIANDEADPEIAEKAAKQYLVMAKQIIDSIHAGKILAEKRARDGK